MMARGLNFHHDGTTDILEFNGQLLIDQNVSSAPALKIESSGIPGSGKSALWVVADAADTTANGFALYTNASNSSATKAPVVFTNAGTGQGVLIDQNGSGTALHIDTEAGNDTKAIDIDFPTYGDNFAVYHNTDVSGACVLKLGLGYLWIDNTGDLRIATTYPSSDTDGAVAGSQT